MTRQDASTGKQCNLFNSGLARAFSATSKPQSALFVRFEMICQCCGEDKSTSHFSSSRATTYTPNCKSCADWLRLFKAKFGPSCESSVRMGRKAIEAMKKEAKIDNVVELYSAFGIQFPVEQQTVEVRTVLANAPWPYREAA